MINFKPFVLIVFSLLIFTGSSCEEDCEVDPDLISDLLGPASEVIQGEPVDWDYVVESVEHNSAPSCKIINAVASIGKIIIDFFEDSEDDNGDMVYDQSNQFGELGAGDSEMASNRIDVFDNDGLYLIEVMSDATNLVKEVNEDNNIDDELLDTRVAQSDIFINASVAFKERLTTTAAIVVVGERIVPKTITEYKGIPIYHAQ